jgi:hypothetical protein
MGPSKMATMGYPARAIRTVIGSGFCLLVASCGQTTSSMECLPGDFEAVTRADGGEDLLRCGADGGAYLPYDGPDPNALPDANVPDATACGADGQKLGYFCHGCSTNSDCAAGLDCQDFTNKGGNICTPECTSATASVVCVAPSEGCGNNGHCKP